jgi:hypothetical protein
LGQPEPHRRRFHVLANVAEVVDDPERLERLSDHPGVIGAATQPGPPAGAGGPDRPLENGDRPPRLLEKIVDRVQTRAVVESGELLLGRVLSTIVEKADGFLGLVLGGEGDGPTSVGVRCRFPAAQETGR